MASDTSHKKAILWTLTLVTILVGAVGCDEEHSVQSPTEPPNLGETISRNNPRSGRLNYDDRMAAIADDVPGFAGFLYDSNQQLVVQLTDVGRLTDARDRVAEFLTQQSGGNARLAAEYNSQVSSMSARPVKYNFRQLHDWHDEIVDKVISHNHSIISSDIDEAENRIVLGVREGEDISGVVAAVEGLAVPFDAVLVRSARMPRFAASLRDKVRPVVGGVKITLKNFLYSADCTLGYNVAVPDSGSWYFVTNSHCTSQLGVTNNDSVHQATANNLIGIEVANSPTFDRGDDQDCPTGRTCMDSDAALFRYTTSSWKHGHIAWPSSSGSTNFSTTKKIWAYGGPILNHSVSVVGQKSGLQWGLVTSTCWNGLAYSEYHGYYYMLCQGRASYGDYEDDEGDSGAPVVSPTYWGDVSSVGLLWGIDAGRTTAYFSSGGAWRSDLSDEMGDSDLYSDIGHSPPPSVTISGPSIVHPDWYCTWNASGSGGVPPYTYTWSGVLSGTGGSIGGMISSSGDLRVTIEDDVDHTDTAYKYITVSSSAPYHPNCSEEDDRD